jgi:hypothetical protein
MSHVDAEPNVHNNMLPVKQERSKATGVHVV